MVFWAGFFLGGIIGATFAIILMCAFFVGKRSDEWATEHKKRAAS